VYCTEIFLALRIELVKFVAFQRQLALFVSPRNGKIIVRKFLLELPPRFCRYSYEKYVCATWPQVWHTDCKCIDLALCKAQPTETTVGARQPPVQHRKSRLSKRENPMRHVRKRLTFEEIFTDLPNPHRGHHRTWRANMERPRGGFVRTFSTEWANELPAL